jgi:hypothetical protein
MFTKTISLDNSTPDARENPGLSVDFLVFVGIEGDGD